MVTALGPRVTSYRLLAGALAVGGAIGAVLAARVEMTSMPQLVAILHSFVGAAAVLVGFAIGLRATGRRSAASKHASTKWRSSSGCSSARVTFTGSVVAFGKLQGVDPQQAAAAARTARAQPRPDRARASISATQFVGVDGANGLPPALPLIVCTALACVLGIHLVMAIGGADMPVVVSMLNSYSGWAAAAAGFMLANDLLIITGALVGSSGAILSYIMCKRHEPLVPQRDPRRLRRRGRRGASRRRRNPRAR